MSWSCPVCRGESAGERGVSLPWGCVRTCSRCGSGALIPRPSAESLAALHVQDEYFDHPYFESRRSLSETMRRVFEVRADHIRRTIGALDGKRVLDVGCDVGLFVEYLGRTEGASAAGIDLFERAVAVGREQGRELYAGTLEQSDLPPGSVDVICAFDLVEHLPSPSAFLGAALPLLAEGGAVVVETPNYAGLVYRLGRLIGAVPGSNAGFGGLQQRLWPPFHVQYFTSRSLAELFRGAGFEPVHAWRRELDAAELAVPSGLVRSALDVVRAVGAGIGAPTLIGVGCRVARHRG